CASATCSSAVAPSGASVKSTNLAGVAVISTTRHRGSRSLGLIFLALAMHTSSVPLTRTTRSTRPRPSLGPRFFAVYPLGNKTPGPVRDKAVGLTGGPRRLLMTRISGRPQGDSLKSESELHQRSDQLSKGLRSGSGAHWRET